MGILRMEQFSKEELENGRIRYKELVIAFNKTHEQRPEDIDQLSYMDFYNINKKSDLTLTEWLEFLSDHRVVLLMDKIMLMKMRSNVNKILSDFDNKSVASSQRLTSSLNFLDKHFEQAMSRETTQYIYTSVPLTEAEEKAANAKTLVIKPKENPYNPARGDRK